MRRRFTTEMRDVIGSLECNEDRARLFALLGDVAEAERVAKSLNANVTELGINTVVVTL